MSKTLIQWTVVHWKKLWRELWFKTANVSADLTWVEPWVYRVNIIVEWKKYSWAGTFLGGSGVFEVHIFDFDEEIYGFEVDVYLIYKLRDNKKFDSLEELKKTISYDVQILKEKKVLAMTFWTFDYVHKWHEFYLWEAKKYADELITVVAKDVSVLHFKWSMPKFSEDKRLKDVLALWIADKVIFWDDKDYYKCIKIYKPSVICLWYDQKSASEWLQKFLDSSGISLNIIRLKPFKENEFKSSLLK